MTQSDERGFRIAVVADEMANSQAAGFDVLEVLERAGWGAILLPPAWYPADVHADLLIQFAEHVEEFMRHGYEVVCIGPCESLAEPLAQLGVAMPPSVTPAGTRDLSTFLSRPRPATTGA
jgi:hypothetical protein